MITVALLPPFSGLMEARLVTHLLVQFPLLAGGGALFGTALGCGRPVRWTAPPALLAGVIALAFWLLPRWIDAALGDPWVNAAQGACLVTLAGLPLGWGWAQAGFVLRGFALANAASMLAVMGWLQLAVPVRLCNNYLLSDQRDLGLGLLALAGLLILSALARALTPPASAGKFSAFFGDLSASAASKGSRFR